MKFTTTLKKATLISASLLMITLPAIAGNGPGDGSGNGGNGPGDGSGNGPGDCSITMQTTLDSFTLAKGGHGPGDGTGNGGNGPGDGTGNGPGEGTGTGDCPNA